MLRKIFADRAAELELNVNSLHVSTDGPVQLLQSNVRVSREQKDLVAVVVSGSVQPRTVLPSNRNLSYDQAQLTLHDRPSSSVPVLETGIQSSEKVSIMKTTQLPEVEDVNNLTAGCCDLSRQSLINVSQSIDIDQRGMVSSMS